MTGRILFRTLLMALCCCMLSSCSSIFYLIESIIQLPFQILNSLNPFY